MCSMERWRLEPVTNGGRASRCGISFLDIILPEGQKERDRRFFPFRREKSQSLRFRFLHMKTLWQCFDILFLKTGLVQT